MRVAAVLMEILRRSGVRHLFGNPGTTELTYLDALPDSGLEYVVALQEATAVAAADGDAQASGQVGVVNIHVAPGVANGLAILHNAARAKSPLLVTAASRTPASSCTTPSSRAISSSSSSSSPSGPTRSAPTRHPRPCAARSSSR